MQEAILVKDDVFVYYAYMSMDESNKDPLYAAWNLSSKLTFAVSNCHNLVFFTFNYWLFNLLYQLFLLV